MTGNGIVRYPPSLSKNYWLVAGAGAAGVVAVPVSAGGAVPVSAGAVVVVVVLSVAAGGVVVVVVPVSAGGVVVVVVEELDELEASGVAGAVVVGCSTVTFVVSLPLSP
jgi:hypothetical protein